jgi:hypothetical protein
MTDIFIFAVATEEELRKHAYEKHGEDPEFMFVCNPMYGEDGEEFFYDTVSKPPYEDFVLGKIWKNCFYETSIQEFLDNLEQEEDISYEEKLKVLSKLIDK